MTNYIVTRADESELEHHGVKGQKWGVSRYKKARSKGIDAKRRLADAQDRESDAQYYYERAGNKMYKSMAKRDVAKDKASSAKSGSKRKDRLTRKSNKYNERVKNFADKRNKAKLEVKNTRSEGKKAKAAYSYAVSKASKEKVQIKDRTLAKHLLVSAINAYGKNEAAKSGKKYDNLDSDTFKTDKDEFDEAVMAYRDKVR